MCGRDDHREKGLRSHVREEETRPLGGSVSPKVTPSVSGGPWIARRLPVPLVGRTPDVPRDSRPTEAAQGGE